ncbi:WhiB family transcriptional regulator [Rhodococcus sp. 14C212]|uniref:WhiB family transcriptional regulator n=1 Tax=Rhodococcus sp. 14C212 TaxID=2711209 RepID=UPI0013EE0DB8|nr:WhiB family transcriptional regulator [Rhodococcus sp. 14C212]
MTTMLTDLLAPSDTAPDWDLAACRGDATPDAWFPDPSESFDYARRVCARCPLVAACATYAGETRQSGIWGGKEFRRGRVTRG